MGEAKAVFLDRDGTIIHDSGYVHKVEDLKFLENSLNALRKFKVYGYELFLVFGQSGIGREYYTVDQYNEFMKKFLEKLRKEGIEFVAVVYCGHTVEDNCNCRKPKTAMVDELIKRYKLNPRNCWNIGDKTADIKMGETVGCKNILVKTGKGGRDGECEINPDYIANDLYDAVNYIIEKDKKIILKEVE